MLSPGPARSTLSPVGLRWRGARGAQWRVACSSAWLALARAHLASTFRVLPNVFRTCVYPARNPDDTRETRVCKEVFFVLSRGRACDAKPGVPPDVGSAMALRM